MNFAHILVVAAFKIQIKYFATLSLCFNVDDEHQCVFFDTSIC